MNLLKIFIWFFIFFLNYAMFKTNVVVGIVFLLIELAIYARINGSFGFGGYRSRRTFRQRIDIDTSNATSLVLELMKMEQNNQIQHTSRNQLAKVNYHSEEHKKLRKAFER